MDRRPRPGRNRGRPLYLRVQLLRVRQWASPGLPDAHGPPGGSRVPQAHPDAHGRGDAAPDRRARRRRSRGRQDLRFVVRSPPGLVVVGAGGLRCTPTRRELLANESGVGPITLFDPEGFEVKIAAECTDFEPKDFMDRKAAQRTDRFAQLGLAAAKLALEDASAWGELEDNAERIGLILGSGLGGVGSIENTQRTMDERGPARVNPFAVTKIMPNSAAPPLRLQLRVQGPSAAPSPGL